MTKYTHKGWLGICPIYIGNQNREAPDVTERHWMLYPLFCAQVFIFDVIGFTAEVFGSQDDWPYPIRITGELNSPIELSDD